MARKTCSLAIAALFACAGPWGSAPSAGAEAQPRASARTPAPRPAKPTQLSTAAVDRSKEAEYKAARSKAQMQYKQAAAKCRKRSTKAIPGCMSEARAARDEALAQAKERWGTAQ